MVPIHEKITALLEQRHLKKRDLARALGVSPQTATDICKGRSAITLPHLRNLVAFFQVRADFWLDEERLLPEASDRTGSAQAPATTPTQLTRVSDPERLLHSIRTFLGRHRHDFLASIPDQAADARLFLGSEDPGGGGIARMADA